QTMRATSAWSYELREPSEQALFRRLAIFVGGCRLEDAAAAAAIPLGDDAEPSPAAGLEGVESLVAKSLLRQVEGNGEPRCAMLATIRDFGWGLPTRSEHL